MNMDKHMLRRIALVLAALILFALPASAQDGLNLPADLFAMLRAAAREPGGAPAFSAAELATIFLGRIPERPVHAAFAAKKAGLG